MIVKVYIYSKDTGLLLYEDTGHPSTVTKNLERNGLDFTLKKPPNMNTHHKWNGKEWEAVDADNQSI